MAQFVSLWLFSLCVTIGVGVAGYCFRVDIPAEAFLIADLVDDAVKTCRSCGIKATRETTYLASKQLDMAVFYANSSLNCLSFLNDVQLTADFWHKGGKLARLFPDLTKSEENNTIVHFPVAGRSVCWTSPSNFSHTSSPRLGFIKSAFVSNNPLDPLGFTLTNDGKALSMLIFDSLQMDNTFSFVAPWEFYFALPFGFPDMPQLGNEEKFSTQWNITATIHNSVAYGYCNNTAETRQFASLLPGVFNQQFHNAKQAFLGYDDVTSIAGPGKDCDPENIFECKSRNTLLACCSATEGTVQSARQCVIDQTGSDRMFTWAAEDTADFLRNSVCGTGNSSAENEPCQAPLDICESAGCCLK
eukprot:CAMPEP_0198233494 /NCGR_PEP_ID=MMETSP1445-20131203/116268_1 /TAXON_ID=36898 /ORGANISM="Pyramimonas sp., Strain CCMP2087" /LENGTH=358 /DNA_ID=CAMNT_0043914189 /DNA_START=375 /DNA_END=1448 /DNA_ORIENTATION=+